MVLYRFLLRFSRKIKNRKKFFRAENALFIRDFGSFLVLIKNIFEKRGVQYTTPFKTNGGVKTQLVSKIE